ncbi:hypothetical protein H9L14_06945 [Sphingomonas sediminicola]|uniref:Tetratricopeptide repeat protein n=1 Tax=Sphingomonas sediminicola TaxID=386874 RepID=A0ABX6TAF5_9SPHN|nr:hypothetical protein [Sphingomonas sediminicola]QNP46780.1 hypothetical protein H9L14_06945 [Sphingomonas sediminicola]
MVLDRSHSRSPELAAEKLKTIAVTVTDDDPLISYKISNRIGASHPDWLLAQLGVAYDTAFALSSLPKAERQEAVQKARVAADKALRMAPDFGDTYAPWCLLHPSTYSRECEDRLRAGMEADPDAPFTPVFLSSLLYKVGRFEESSQFARTGLAGIPSIPTSYGGSYALRSCSGKRKKRSNCSRRQFGGGPSIRVSTGIVSLLTHSPAISTARRKRLGNCRRAYWTGRDPRLRLCCPRSTRVIWSA